MLDYSALSHVLALKSFWESVFHFDHHSIMLQHDLMGHYIEYKFCHY